MIWPTIGRALAVLFGFLLAVLSGAIVLFLIGAQWAAREATSYLSENTDEMSLLINEGLGIFAFIFTVAPALTLLPAILAIVVGEIARIRSLLFYVLAGGAAAAVMPLISMPQQAAENASYTTPYFTMLATAGFAAGFVYWLIAGRKA